MAKIVSKKTPKIQKGIGYTYDPATFAKQHTVQNFLLVEDPVEILDRIQPLVYNNKRLITFDTETHAYYKSNHEVPPGIVRRWVDSGKKASPQDYPFVMSVCDGTNAFTIYDSVENGFAKFRQLEPLFMDPTIEKIAHNCKFDMHMFANIGMQIRGRIHDTVVLAKLADENRISFKLRDLAAKNKHGIVKFEYMVDNYKQMNKVTDYRQIPKELLVQYANADVWNAMVTFLDEYPKIEQDGLVELYDHESELTIALYAMERRGMPVDLSYEKPLKDDLQRITDNAEAAIYEEAKGMFNINSGKQLYNVLLNLGVSPSWIPMTEKNNPSLDKDALEALAEVHDVSIVKKILEFRKYEKLLTTYATGIYDQRDADTCVHGNINQTEATTGRMSITKPALQTLPKKDKRIRRCFMPAKGFSLYFMDLDQIEYRLFAHYAKIPSLLEAIKNGYDVHAATAAMIFHTDLDELIKWLNHDEPSKDDPEYENIKAQMSRASDMRGKGKTINFALIYGVGEEHLSTLLKCSKTEASELKAQYFALLPEARTFISTVHSVIKVRGYVKNYYSRRRRLDPDDSYKAPNALIQSCAADYIKRKMVMIYKYIMYHDLKSYLANIVHDELVEMVADGEEEHLPVFRWLLSDFETFRCPITAGVERGEPSWGQKVAVNTVDFKEPEDKSFLNYDVYNGDVFCI
jgi:DNA polymerase-1